MPDDRFIHRRQGFSPQVCSLSDFEHRVWIQYQLSADDYGVMPYSASKVRGDNMALERRDEASVFLALKRIVELGLLVQFTHITADHTAEFVFDPVWQDTQKIRWPSKTLYPAPPEEMLAKASPNTWNLYTTHHPGSSSEVLPKNLHEVLRDDSESAHRLEARSFLDSESLNLPETSSETVVQDSRPRPKRRGRPPLPLVVDHPIKAILTEYDRLFLLKSHGEPAPQPGAKEAALVKRLLGRYDQPQIIELLGKYFESTDEFIRQAGYALQVFPSQIPKLLLASQASRFFSPKTAGNETALASYIAKQRAADTQSSLPTAILSNPFRLMRPKE